MTEFVGIGIGCWILLLIVGGLIKKYTMRKVTGLDGFKGITSKREHKKHGEIIAKFGD